MRQFRKRKNAMAQRRLQPALPETGQGAGNVRKRGMVRMGGSPSLPGFIIPENRQPEAKKTALQTR